MFVEGAQLAELGVVIGVMCLLKASVVLLFSVTPVYAILYMTF